MRRNKGFRDLEREIKKGIDTRYGKPAYRQLKYCTRCCMPETRMDITFDEMGICDACRAHEEKMRIDWSKREKNLRAIL